LSPRRSTFNRTLKSTASELPSAPKSVELEQRLARLEICCRDMRALIEHLNTQAGALRAEIDYLSARLRFRG
jgi:hypothetical protein